MKTKMAENKTMLLLSRVRLINWHFFSDSTIQIDQMTLLAGDNGSGKSTIIDAIQYALVANIKKIKFNSAAMDARSGRNLESYCRCKIGTDNLDYIRGDTITHVILEFSDLNRSFCAGIMVESFKETRDAGEHCYVIDNAVIPDIQVKEGSKLLSIDIFKKKIKEMGGALTTTKKDYNSKLTHLLGVHRRNLDSNPYLDTVVRSVNFTPLSSVDRFVCEYILEERQVDISAMRENLNNYREAEKEALRIETRIKQLEVIERSYREILEIRKQIILQELLLKKLDLDICHTDIKFLAERREKTIRDLKLIEEKIEYLHKDKQQKNILIDELRSGLNANDKFRMLDGLNRRKKDLEESIAAEENQLEKAALLKSQIEVLLSRKIKEDPEIEIQFCGDEKEESLRKKINTEREYSEIKRSLNDMKTELEELSRGIFRYDERSIKLAAALKQNGIESFIFVDLLEITDHEWQNAVEGWLNTQRFNILVYEKDFQRALSVYNSLPSDVHSVGIPDLDKMKNSEIRPGSLAEIVTTSSPLARRYAASLLGEVMMASLENLRDYRKSITKECMRYSGFTASRISPKIYEQWFIGKKAREQRKSNLESSIAENEISARDKKNDIENLAARIEIFSRAVESLYDLKHLSGSARRLAEHQAEIFSVNESISAIDKSEFEKIQIQISSLTYDVKQQESELDNSLMNKGSLMTTRDSLEMKISEKENEEIHLKNEFNIFQADNPSLSDEFTSYYSERVLGKQLNDVKTNFERNRRGNETRLANSARDLESKKNEFNRENSLYLPVDFDSSGQFIELLEKYRGTELPQFREKISRAREDAEKQFKEHFVTRLNEYIEEARQSFDEINSTLKNISFGRDLYRFTLEVKTEKRNTLEVIKTASRISGDRGTLFDQLNSPEEKETVNRLFASILDNEPDSAAVKELCDYRSYFTYDIKITHEELPAKDVSSLSRVLREKSGGETQTPYYVAIAASFFRFFRDNDSAVRLVLFDEAFNKMDDERIGKTIEFFKRIGIQIVTAVPTEKIEPIAPFMDRTNIIIRHGNSAFVRDYSILTRGSDNENVL